MKLPTIKGFDEEALKKYFKNTGMLLIGKVGSLAIKMLSSIAVANYLLSYGNGILTTSVSYVFLFAALAGLGLDQFIVKELHQFPERRDSILGSAFSMKSIAGLICIPLIYISWSIYPLEGIKFGYIFLLSFMGIFQSFTVIDSYFQSEVKSKYIMQVQIIGNLVSAAIKVCLILTHSNLTLFFFAYLFDTVLLSIGYVISYNQKGRSILAWTCDWKLSKKLLSLSWPLIVSGIMVSIYMRVDQIMLKQILGEHGIAEAGAYNTVVMFSEALNFVPIAIVSSLFPAILNARRDDKERYQKRLQNLYDLMVWLSLSFALFITFASPLIYKLYKPEYIAAAKVLSVHVWGSIFVFLGVASGQFLIAENFGHLSFIRTGLGAIVNIILNIILIPKMGMMGTAIATVIAYFVSAFFVLFIPKLRQQGIMMLKSLFLITAFQKIFKR
ncbi:flippase [Pedobacter aquatilis]|uniref:flippase n=1 Tax=Pedobacter aquatilis TaxID=351343 RepID=UPI00292D9B69|nr:flippase [Pedobacter aquatilis]